MVAKSKEVKTICNLAEPSKEDHGSKRVVLLLMIMTGGVRIMKLVNIQLFTVPCSLLTSPP
jgi:hypothetical protein